MFSLLDSLFRPAFKAISIGEEQTETNLIFSSPLLIFFRRHVFSCRTIAYFKGFFFRSIYCKEVLWAYFSYSIYLSGVLIALLVLYTQQAVAELIRVVNTRGKKIFFSNDQFSITSALIGTVTSGRWLWLETPPKQGNELMNHQWNPVPVHKQNCSSRTVPPWRQSSFQLSQDGTDNPQLWMQSLKRTNNEKKPKTTLTFVKSFYQLLSAK